MQDSRGLDSKFSQESEAEELASILNGILGSAVESIEAVFGPEELSTLLIDKAESFYESGSVDILIEGLDDLKNKLVKISVKKYRKEQNDNNL